MKYCTDMEPQALWSITGVCMATSPFCMAWMASARRCRHELESKTGQQNEAIHSAPTTALCLSHAVIISWPVCMLQQCW